MKNSKNFRHSLKSRLLWRINYRPHNPAWLESLDTAKPHRWRVVNRCLLLCTCLPPYRNRSVMHAVLLTYNRRTSAANLRWPGRRSAHNHKTYGYSACTPYRHKNSLDVHLDAPWSTRQVTWMWQILHTVRSPVLHWTVCETKCDSSQG